MSMEPLETPGSYEPDINEMMLSGWRMTMLLNGQERDIASPYISAMRDLPISVMKYEKDIKKALKSLDSLKKEFYESFYFPQMPTNLNDLDGLGHVASIEDAYNEAKQKINECS